MEDNPFDSVCNCAFAGDIKPVFAGMVRPSSAHIKLLKMKIKPFKGLNFLPKKKKLSKKDYILINLNLLNNGK